MTLAAAVAAARTRDDALVIRDLTVAYGNKLVFKGVNADIPRGLVVGVIGPNGGGKSTLLKAILGLAPIVAGTVTLFGRPASQMRSHIAYVPQREAVDWDFPVTVRDVVLMGRYPRARWRRLPTREDIGVAMDMLERVRMADFRDRQIGQLSGGQQQRVFIARALAQEADVLLLDEPMTGIDAATQEIVLDVIEQQQRDRKIILIATHDLVRPWPVIMLERVGQPPLVHVHEPFAHAHHQHTHEYLGAEHD